MKFKNKIKLNQSLGLKDKGWKSKNTEFSFRAYLDDWLYKMLLSRDKSAGVVDCLCSTKATLLLLLFGKTKLSNGFNWIMFVLGWLVVCPLSCCCWLLIELSIWLGETKLCNWCLGLWSFSLDTMVVGVRFSSPEYSSIRKKKAQ